MSEPQPKYLSPQQAAAQASVSVDLIRDLIAAGDLPCYRIGNGRGLLRIRVDDFEALFRPVPAAKAV